MITLVIEHMEVENIKTTTSNCDKSSSVVSDSNMKNTSDESLEQEIVSCKMDESQTLTLENNEAIQVHIHQDSTNGQLTYKFVPLNNSDQIITTLNGSVNHHQNIITGNDGSEAKLSVLSALENPVYLMMPTADIVQANHKILTKSSSNSKIFSSSTKTVRDERRRANHNEVERRRRDNINKWIVELSKVIPDCSNDHTKHGQSKGGILEKTVQYISDLKNQNHQLIEHIKKFETIEAENILLKQENEKIKHDNEAIRNQIHKLSETASKAEN